MKKWSGGKIKTEVYPYGILGATGDINEKSLQAKQPGTAVNYV